MVWSHFESGNSISTESESKIYPENDKLKTAKEAECKKVAEQTAEDIQIFKRKVD